MKQSFLCKKGRKEEKQLFEIQILQSCDLLSLSEIVEEMS